MITLDTYKGVRVHNYANGVLVSVEDTRTVEGEQLKLKYEMKLMLNERILEKAPLHKQNNVALGLASAEDELLVKTTIQNGLNASNEIKEALNNAKTLDDIDAVNIIEIFNKHNI